MHYRGPGQPSDFLMRFRRLTLLLVLSLPVTTLLLSCSRDPAVRQQKAMERGNREFNEGKYPEAMIYYGQALQVDSHYAEAHYKLAQCHVKLGSWASAFRELARTVELQPENWPAQLQLAELTLRGGKAQDAKDRALLILRSNPKNADAEMVLSSSDAALGDSKSALQEAKDATQMARESSSISVFSKPEPATLHKPKTTSRRPNY